MLWLIAMRRRGLLATCLLVLGCLIGCGPQYPDPSYPASASAGEAIATAVAAGVLWAAAGGCNLQGCPYGSFCEEKSGFCRVRKCSQGCPAMTTCNEGLDLCQAPPSAQAASGFLPQNGLRSLGGGY